MNLSVAFRDRFHAGRCLAKELEAYAGREDAIVLGLARGGIPVAYEVASHLRLPLDVFIVRKLGVPGYGELAMGAIASGGVRVVNRDVLHRLLPDAEQVLETVTEKETAELERREVEYREGRHPLEVTRRVSILIDDGLATGASMRAAAAALRQKGAARIIVAVPVGSLNTCREFEHEVNEVICVNAPEWFEAVAHYYEDFSQTTDDEVRALLAAAAENLKERDRGNSHDLKAPF
ncbi:MAG: phosphoribosyltransferase [Chthoniobacterales bacterium]|nr:phosphoribosyltransferase [Chthoniobacterales bacterium]